MNSQSIHNTNQKFIQEYGKALLVVLPQIIYLAIIYYIQKEYWLEDTGYLIFTFIASTIVGFITLKVTLQFVRDEYIDTKEIFNPIESLLQYILYTVLLFAVQFIVLHFIGEISIDLVASIIEPFGVFISNASSFTGLLIRVLIVFNILVFIYAAIAFLLIHKFILVAFAIVDGENIVEAFKSSWSETTDYMGEIFITLFNLLLKIMILINVYIIIFYIVIFNSMSTADGILKFMNFILYAISIFYFLPYFNLAYGSLYKLIRG